MWYDAICIRIGDYCSLPLLTGVASIWCEEGHETKRKLFIGGTQKYYEIHAINGDKAIGLHIFTGQETTWSRMLEFVQLWW